MFFLLCILLSTTLHAMELTSTDLITTHLIYTTNKIQKKDASNNHSDQITALAYTHTGNILIGFKGQGAALFKAETKEFKYNSCDHRSDFITALAYTCAFFDGKKCEYLISGSHEGELSVWNLKNSITINTRDHNSSSENRKITSLAVYGKAIAAGAHDGKISLWNIKNEFGTTNHIANFKAHTASITALAFNTNGSQLASSACDGNVHVWSTDPKNMRKDFTLFKGIVSAETKIPMEQIDEIRSAEVHALLENMSQNKYFNQFNYNNRHNDPLKKITVTFCPSTIWFVNDVSLFICNWQNGEKWNISKKFPPRKPEEKMEKKDIIKADAVLGEIILTLQKLQTEDSHLLTNDEKKLIQALPNELKKLYAKI